MKKQLLSLAILLGSFSLAQTTYSNGGLSTGATSSNGTAAPSGYTWSELQAGNSSYGISGVYTATSSFRLADDFVVPAGQKWTISSIEVFAYQTNSTSFPFDGLNLQIWNGNPSAAGTVVFGDTTTNVLSVSASSDSKMYRIASTSVGTTRKIWKLKANISKTLDPGTYWLDYQGHATNASAGFFPAVTLVGLPGPSDANGLQYASATSAWTTIVDTGSSAAQALPFIITYTVTALGVTETRQFDSRLTLYPNPVANSFKLDIPAESKTQNTLISLYDAAGKMIKSFKVADSYDISDLPKGNYLLKLNDGQNTKVTKLIKK